MKALLVASLGFALACDDHRSAVAPNAATAPASRAPTSRSPGCGKAEAHGLIAQHVTIMNKGRSYALAVPVTYAPDTAYPLVYVLHGQGGSGAQVRAALDLEHAAKDKALFLYPDGLNGGWDLDSATAKNPDVELFDATLAFAVTHYCVDLDRVFVAGFSNGAYMANQLGCRRGDRIRGVASHSGGGPYDAAGTYDDHGNLVCRTPPVASLVVHGTADPTVAPSEGKKSIDHWTQANHCGGPARWSVAQGCVAYEGCAKPVVSCAVPALGHTVWNQARSAIWTFFDDLK